jgi:hypothetical protein
MNLDLQCRPYDPPQDRGRCISGRYCCSRACNGIPRRFRQRVRFDGGHSQSRQTDRYKQLRSPAHSITGGHAMRATTKVRALPEESWDPALWSIAAAFSLAVVYLARLS